MAEAEPAAQAYVDALDPEQRALFDRVHTLVLADHPDVRVTISYQLPTYVHGEFRLYVGAWKHGISFYGWSDERGGAFADAHPELKSGRSTLRLTPAAAAGIDDAELRAFLRAALGD